MLAGAKRSLAGEVSCMVNPADTAWMLISTALVLLMTPALAFFRRARSQQERAEHDDDEFHLVGVRGRAVGMC